MIGAVLRDYRVVTELGSGGMGTVYFAEHQAIGRRAAIKVLNKDIAANEGMVERFFNEAKAVSAIRHPNIVDVTDFGRSDDGAYFIVMELLEGETIGARLETKSRFEVRPALEILLQVCAALGAAHEHGIVHRDLKPENIFLTNHPDYPDFAKVLDFGVVKLMAKEGQPRSHTQPGLIIGTPAYMSPEQCAGDVTLDQRSDIYSLGVVAFQMLTGVVPFEGNPPEVMNAHLHTAPPSVRSINPAVPEALDVVIACTLAKKPSDRFASMRELREAFRAVREGRAPNVLPAPEPPAPAVQPSAIRAAPPAPVQRQKPPRRPPLISVAPAALSLQEAKVREVVEQRQSVRAGDKLKDIVVKRLAENTLTLPALPVVALKCLDLLNDPTIDLAQVSAALEVDPLVASRVLRIVNSPLYGTRERIVSLDLAVSRLGVNPLRTLLQELAAAEVFSSRNPRIREIFNGIWHHCLAVAHLSRALAQKLPGAADPNAAYLAGLFHDIGKPLAGVLLLEAERVLLEGEGLDWMSESLWFKVVNHSHRGLGLALAQRWNLPTAVLEAITSQDEIDPRQGRRSAANLVRLANALTKREGFSVGPFDQQQVDRLIEQSHQVLGTDQNLEEAALDTMRTRLEMVPDAEAESLASKGPTLVRGTRPS